MKLQAVIFDRDNTLMHFDNGAIAALEQRISAVAPSLPPGAAVRHWLGWSGPWPRTPADEPAFWRAFWVELARAHRLAADAADRLQDIGAFYHTCFAAFSDTNRCLAELRARGYRLAILTNFELPSVQATLRHAGVEPGWFDALLSSAELGCYKPDPRAYLAAAAAMHLPPAACAFVDDLPENVAAACALGMRGWLIDRSGAAAPAGTTICSLAELPARIAACQQA
jgi:putative hydrolase of the HAD superfamily